MPDFVLKKYKLRVSPSNTDYLWVFGPFDAGDLLSLPEMGCTSSFGSDLSSEEPSRFIAPT